MRQIFRKTKIGLGIVFTGATLLSLQACNGASSTNAPDAKSASVQPKATSPAMAARRLVKTTTDPDASKIDKSIKDTTVEDLISHKASGTLAGREDPFEMTTWRIKATVESIEQKKDGDYYMVLRGEKGGQTVVEVPDPATCKGSPFESQIASTRKALEEKYHPTKDKKDVNEEATITGVGFLGFGTNPTKKGSGGITGSRLMPGTDVKFGH